MRPCLCRAPQACAPGAGASMWQDGRAAPPAGCSRAPTRALRHRSPPRRRPAHLAGGPLRALQLHRASPPAAPAAAAAGRMRPSRAGERCSRARCLARRRWRSRPRSALPASWTGLMSGSRSPSPGTLARSPTASLCWSSPCGCCAAAAGGAGGGSCLLSRRRHRSLSPRRVAAAAAGRQLPRAPHPPGHASWSTPQLSLHSPCKFPLGCCSVIWRDAEGRFRCFRDACPHRLVPLSDGRITPDGQLQCGWGWAGLGWAACGASGPGGQCGREARVAAQLRNRPAPTLCTDQPSAALPCPPRPAQAPTTAGALRCASFEGAWGRRTDVWLLHAALLPPF